MHITTRAFRLQKAGNSSDEYEDACWPERALEYEGLRFSCAMADGATETSYSALWAQLLVQKWCLEDAGWEGLVSVMPELQRQWQAQVGAEPRPWYVEEKIRSGAFAALVGLSITSPDEISPEGGLTDTARWSATAVGDSCLFHIRDNRLVAAFPLEHPDAFDNRPRLIGSTLPLEQLSGSIHHREGECRSGDSFLLMTDALACWFLRRELEDYSGLLCLSDIEIQETFELFVAEERAARDALGRPSLRNDDVTLLRIDLSP